MSDYDGETSCVRKCCMRGGIIGLVLAAILFLFAGYGFFSAIFIGIVVAVVLAVILWFLTCRTEDAPVSRQSVGGSSGHGASASAGAAASGADTAEPAEAAPAEAAPEEAAPAAASSAFEVKPTKPLPGQAELASRKGEWKYQGDDAAPAGLVSEVPASKPVPKAKKADAKPKAAAKPKRAAVAADGKPETFDGPQAGAADDLKLISGVGPKLEQTLNDLGIWHFSQVAGWRKKEIEWVDSRLKFKGRIERDDWISQAKILAKGGETEFSKRKKK